MIRLGLLLLVSIASFSISENRGVSHLGLCHPQYNCGAMMRSFSGTSVIRTGWLDNTFNPTDCKCLPNLQKSKKPVVVRVHILNGAGLRNRRLEKHEIMHGETIKSLENKILNGDKEFNLKFENRLRIVREQIINIKKLKKCYVSPIIETDFKKPARKKLLNKTKKFFPRCSIVDNPLKHDCIKGYVCEKHGDFKSLKGRYIADLDGLSLFSISQSKWGKTHKNAELALTWDYCNNLNLAYGEFIPPTKRTESCDSYMTRIFNSFIKGR